MKELVGKTKNKDLQKAIKELAKLTSKQHKTYFSDRAEYFNQNKKAAIEAGNVAEAERFEQEYSKAKQDSEMTLD